MQHATVFPVRPAVPKAELRALAARSDRKGLVQFGGHLALLAVTGSAVLWAEGSWGDSWALAPALLAHGIVLVFLFAPLHETIHRTAFRSEEHTSELQSLMLISYAVFCLKKKKDLHITYI